MGYNLSAFGKKKQQWLKKFLQLPNGIPSHDTLGRVFALLDPDEFQQCFFSWVDAVSELTKGAVVAIDGKSVRRSHKKGVKPLHLISAFAVENGITIGQKKVDGKTNEITAIPELLKMLKLKGCIVTIDAMGTQGWIVKKIREKKADYALAVKANQKRLLQDIKKTLAEKKKNTAIDYYQTSEGAHGRKETRECWITKNLSNIRDIDKWTGLKSIARITHTRTVNKKTTTETRYYITSLKPNAKKVLQVVREHWAIENNLHWTLDVAFREDESRIRIGHAQENLALVCKLALTLLRQETSAKGGIKSRRLQAGWDNEYLLKLLGLKEL